MTEPLHHSLDRLATRILAGEVVFLVGAGASLDSEGNTAQLLIARLVARFEALSASLLRTKESHVQEHAHKTKQEVRDEIIQTANDLRTGLRETFWLRGSGADGSVMRPGVVKKNIDALAQSYYQINDWMCSAYDSLLGCLASMKNVRVNSIHKAENRLLDHYHRAAGIGNAPLLQRLEPQRFLKLRGVERETPADAHIAGKALFLDTMGFADPLVMAGKPLDPDFRKLHESYARLRPRHDVLARLAAEGLCPILLTTNYDLLLEGAFRLNGLLPRELSELFAGDRKLDRTTANEPARRLAQLGQLRHFARVADATGFFTFGDGYRSALLTKIHGCAEAYRRARDKPDPANLRATLRTMVFTYREIQNWREDSWSRDFLRTLLRTRTIVFCGYSGIDPVIHDTFRSVYEEMERQRRVGHSAENGAAPAMPQPPEEFGKAAAFFMDLGDKRDFHGLEILRAATRARGVPTPPLTDHPNLLRFERGDRPGFPHLDELLRWVFHMTCRKRQKRAVESELRRVASQLLGHPCPEPEFQTILRRFKEILDAEEETSRRLAEEPPKPAAKGPLSETDKVRREQQRQGAIRRRQLNRMTAWTEHFHRSVMREFALAEVLMRETGPSTDVRELSERPWYYPLGDHPDWAAWGVVIEIALRRRIAAWRGIPHTLWAQDSPWVEAVEHAYPAVLFAENNDTGNEWPAPPNQGTAAANGTSAQQANSAAQEIVPPQAPPRITPAARHSIALRLQDLEHAGRRAPLLHPLRARPPVIWAVPDDGAAWWRNPDLGKGDVASGDRRPRSTPSARTLWRWAIGDMDPRPAASRHDTSPAELAAFFGESNDSQQPANAA